MNICTCHWCNTSDPSHQMETRLDLHTIYTNAAFFENFDQCFAPICCSVVWPRVELGELHLVAGRHRGGDWVTVVSSCMCFLCMYDRAIFCTGHYIRHMLTSWFGVCRTGSCFQQNVIHCILFTHTPHTHISYQDARPLTMFYLWPHRHLLLTKFI